MNKVCPKCRVDKPLTNEFFAVRSSRKSGFHSRCKTCRNEDGRLFKLVFVESGRSSAYSKEYHAQHREERIAYAKQNYQKNINLNRRKAIENRRQKADYYREYNRIYQNKHKVNRAIRSGLYGCLMGRKKSSKSFDYIGLSPAAFKLHLESLFLPGMTWENYGNPNGDHTECWHIDHKIPIASFCLDVLNGERLEQALHEAWHYSNLQPLWAKDNLSKGDRLL